MSEFVTNTGGRGHTNGWLGVAIGNPHENLQGKTTVEKIEIVEAEKNTAKITLTAAISDLKAGDYLFIEVGSNFYGAYLVKGIEGAGQNKVVTVTSGVLEEKVTTTWTGTKPNIGKVVMNDAHSMLNLKEPNLSKNTVTVQTLDSLIPTQISASKEYSNVEITALYHKKNIEVQLLRQSFEKNISLVFATYLTTNGKEGTFYFGEVQEIERAEFKGGDNSPIEHSFTISHTQAPTDFDLTV